MCQRIVCADQWGPSQVLDDSTDPHTRNLVDDKVAEWRERGLDIDCIRRTNRSGYKAGALKEVGPSNPLQCLTSALLNPDFGSRNSELCDKSTPTPIASITILMSRLKCWSMYCAGDGAADGLRPCCGV